MADISVIILTLDEEKHIRRCIDRVRPFAKEVHVVDSFSSDATVEIAKSLGAQVVQHEFVNHADQLNWALDTLPISTAWVMRVDADEYLLPELAEELNERLELLGPEVAGITLQRRVIFLGRWIRHGGIYPMIRVRIWRTGHGRAESRSMDELMEIDGGGVVAFDHDIVDENINSLTWWTDKHNRYATNEAEEILADQSNRETDQLTGPGAGNRWAKQNIYLRLPPGGRAWAYFIYRYLFRMGFRDGTEGLIFHTLQGLWYRFLADAKAYESASQFQDESSRSARIENENVRDHQGECRE